MKYEVGPDRSFPGAWRVEAINFAGEGQVYMTTFFGLKGEERAREYAAWKNGQEPGEPCQTSTSTSSTQY